jgi:hypothetical protein
MQPEPQKAELKGYIKAVSRMKLQADVEIKKDQIK